MIVNASFRLAANATHGKAVKGDLNIYSVDSSIANHLIIKDLVTFGMNTSFFFTFHCSDTFDCYACGNSLTHDFVHHQLISFSNMDLHLQILGMGSCLKNLKLFAEISEASKVPNWYKYMSPTSYMVESKIQNFIFYIMCVVINIENYALNKFQAMTHFTCGQEAFLV